MFRSAIITLLSIWIILVSGRHQSHPCNRPCSQTQPRLLCEYSFVIEWRRTMSLECGKCPTVRSDCYSPGCIAADGLGRPIITVNGQSPGPAIEICEGDTVSVKVKNLLLGFEGTTIHWHGIHMHGVPWMDGVPLVTQCPIPYATTFTYRFTPKEIGTHFWHGHVSTQRADGLYGAFVIRQAPQNNVHYGEYQEDRSDHVLVVTDSVKGAVIEKFTFHLFNGGNESPDSILVNGRGVHASVNPSTPREIIPVKGGRRYRLRIIQAGYLSCPYVFSIQNHKFKLIATEGNPVFSDGLQDTMRFMSGETMDIIVETNQPPGNYWIYFKGEQACEEMKTVGAAILHYRECPYTEPYINNPINYAAISNGPDTVDYTKYKSHISLVNEDLMRRYRATKTFYLALDSDRVKQGDIYIPHINGIELIYPTSPVLTQFSDVKLPLCNVDNLPRECKKPGRDPNIPCKCLHAIQVDVGDVVDMVFIDQGRLEDFDHSMHLHGGHFRVLSTKKMDHKPTVAEIKHLDANYRLARNFKNPIRKNTLHIPKPGYGIARFHATNPGVWLMHCHLQFHADRGMALAFVVGDPKRDFPQHPVNFPKCGDWEPPEEYTPRTSKNGKGGVRHPYHPRHRTNDRYPYPTYHGKHGGNHHIKWKK